MSEVNKMVDQSLEQMNKCLAADNHVDRERALVLGSICQIVLLQKILNDKETPPVKKGKEK